MLAQRTDTHDRRDRAQGSTRAAGAAARTLHTRQGQPSRRLQYTRAPMRKCPPAEHLQLDRPPRSDVPRIPRWRAPKRLRRQIRLPSLRNTVNSSRKAVQDARLMQSMATSSAEQHETDHSPRVPPRLLRWSSHIRQRLHDEDGVDGPHISRRRRALARLCSGLGLLVAGAFVIFWGIEMIPNGNAPRPPGMQQQPPGMQQQSSAMQQQPPDMQQQLQLLDSPPLHEYKPPSSPQPPLPSFLLCPPPSELPLPPKPPWQPSTPPWQPPMTPPDAPIPQAERALRRFEKAFRTNGLLAHVVVLEGGGDSYMRKLLDASASQPLPLHKDCGQWCTAFSLWTPQLPLATFGGDGLQIGFGLVYEADARAWRHVQCTSVTDSNTANRACCACFEQNFCPVWGLPRKDPGYCADTCSMSDSESQARCKQLAAGCGMNTRTIITSQVPRGSTHQCSLNAVVQGTCALCRRPQWCYDPNSTTDFAFGVQTSTAAAWKELFFHKWWLNARQCKYKPSQRELFVDVTREYHKSRQSLPDHRDGEPTIENEVNVYVEPDGSTEADFAESLVGLVLFRGVYTSSHLRSMRSVQTHLQSIGVDVPIFSITTEPIGQAKYWDSTKNIDDLRGRPYGLTVI